jgi:hypothetical protein
MPAMKRPDVSNPLAGKARRVLEFAEQYAL